MKLYYNNELRGVWLSATAIVWAGSPREARDKLQGWIEREHPYIGNQVVFESDMVEFEPETEVALLDDGDY